LFSSLRFCNGCLVVCTVVLVLVLIGCRSNHHHNHFAVSDAQVLLKYTGYCPRRTGNISAGELPRKGHFTLSTAPLCQRLQLRTSRKILHRRPTNDVDQSHRHGTHQSAFRGSFLVFLIFKGHTIFLITYFALGRFGWYALHFFRLGTANLLAESAEARPEAVELVPSSFLHGKRPLTPKY